jgi:chaperonin GroEL
VKGENADQDAGIKIVRARWRLRSARSPKTPASKARSSSARSAKTTTRAFGFNAQTEEYGDMIKWASSTRPRSSARALQDAASVAGPADHHRSHGRRKPKKEGAGGGMPDMGGMGGMEIFDPVAFHGGSDKETSNALTLSEPCQDRE